jgi:drug/metabolite transporter (DMT)-like permease
VTDSTRAWLQMNFCVILWGFTAILGKTITLPALPLVWLRMIVVTAALLFIPAFWRGLSRMSPSLIAIYVGIGVFVTAHWVTFYSSIKLANASVAATCMALTPVFVALIEPAVVRRRFDVREVLFGVAAIPGMVLVVGGTPGSMRIGIAVGILSAFLAAVFSALNKRFIDRGAALAVTGLEMAAGVICLSFLSPLVLPGRRDAILLVVLAIGCTLIPFALSLVALRHLSAFSAALAVNMEPVYAIVLAAILLGEQRELTTAFYVGVAVIMAVVFGHGQFERRQERLSRRNLA